MCGASPPFYFSLMMIISKFNMILSRLHLHARAAFSNSIVTLTGASSAAMNSLRVITPG
jgi:hypothetical protein